MWQSIAQIERADAYEERIDNYLMRIPKKHMYKDKQLNQNVIYKKITDKEKIMCPITCENIIKNENYMTCNKCRNNFNKSALMNWFQTKYSCPACRTMWMDFNTYINGEEPKQKQKIVNYIFSVTPFLARNFSNLDDAFDAFTILVRSSASLFHLAFCSSILFCRASSSNCF